MDAHREIRGLLKELRTLAPSSAVLRITDQIETLSSAYADPEPVLEIAYRLRLQPQWQRLFAILYRRRGRTVARESIWNALYSGDPDDWPDMKIIGVYVYHLRKALKDTSYRITAVRGLGYRLDDLSNATTTKE